MASRPNRLQFLTLYGDDIKRELVATSKYERAGKDILIVTHNELPLLQQCVQSIRDHTEDYHIYVWDNGSESDVWEWLNQQADISVTRSENNEGFIIPNNRLATQGKNPFVILLNNDTVVYDGWDRAMIAHCQQGFAQVGYVGGWLNEEGKGACFGWGSEVDYIPGWCFTIPRIVYDGFGLFDEKNLTFAYGEDADLSLRLTEAGAKILALHLDWVYHYENVTIKTVQQKLDCKASFEANHAFLRGRHGKRLGRNSLCTRVVGEEAAV